MKLPLWLFVAACGAPPAPRPVTPPPPPPADAPPGIAIDAFDTTPNLSYRACFTGGHVAVEYGDPAKSYRLQFDSTRDRDATDLRAGGAAWRVGDSSDGDLSQELTIDGRLPDETPQHYALSDGSTRTYVSTAGIDRTELRELLSHLRSSGSHRIGELHLSLPVVDAVFEGVRLESSTPDTTVPRYSSEQYVAQFTRKSQWVQQAPWGTLAGAPFWFAPFAQPTNDHTGTPTIPAWHGEATIGSLVLVIHAVGTAVTAERYQRFAKAVIEAALRGGDASCRARSGHMF